MMPNEKSRSQLNYEARVNLATAYRACNYYKLDQGIFNHLTQRAPARDREGDVMLVCPYGLLWMEVTASCLIGVDFETGEVVEGEGEIAETANAIHRAIHKTRYPIDGITSVMHSHQPYSTSLACVNDPEPFKYALSQDSMFFYNKIAYHCDYKGYAHDEEEGYSLAKALGDKTVLMMGNHGVLVVHKLTADAFGHLFLLEEAAKKQVIVQSTGMKMQLSPVEVCERVASPAPDGDRDFALFFNALKRMFHNKL